MLPPTGGGGQTPYNEPVDPNKSDIDDNKSNVREDVVILDEDKISWIDVVTDYIVEQKELDSSFSYPIVGNGSQGNPYQVASAMDLAYLSYKTQSNNDFLRNKYVELTDDIIMNDGYFEEDGTYHDGGDGILYEWKSIKIYQSISKFEGNGFKISGLYMNDETSRAGMFTGDCNCGTIQNLNVENFYFFGSTAYLFGFYRIYNVINIVTDGFLKSKAGMALYSDLISTLKNCINYAKLEQVDEDGKYNSRYAGDNVIGGFSVCAINTITNCINYGDMKIAGTYSYIGCFCGQSYGQAVTISDSYNYGNIVAPKCSMLGGFYGEVGGQTAKFSNCQNYGNIKGSQYISGFFGYGYGGTTVISDCQNYGTMKGAYSGGFLGYSQSSQSYSFVNLTNWGEISGGYSGGVAGSIAGGRFFNCKNYALIKGAYRLGGLVGASVYENYKATFSNCVNNGEIKCNGNNYIGGIFGYAGRCEMTYCENNGKVSGWQYIGGLVGIANSDGDFVKLVYCVNNGNVTSASTARFAGLIGGVNDRRNINVNYCINNGEVKGSSGGWGITYFDNAGNSSNSLIKNCIVRCNLQSSGGVFTNSNSKVQNCVAECTVNGVSTKKFKGDDFSAFYINRKKGIIGLKALDDAGIFGICIVDKSILSSYSFQEIT